MNDRELLEQAAKAAGIEGYKFMIGAYAKSDAVGLHIRNYGTSNQRVWNPLADDGDALRLAVKLGLHLFQSKHYVRCGRKTIDMPIEESKRDQNPYAATRRAIVRAAAEIGKEMK